MKTEGQVNCVDLFISLSQICWVVWMYLSSWKASTSMFCSLGRKKTLASRLNSSSREQMIRAAMMTTCWREE